MTRRVLSQGRPVIFYVHPREIDLQAPRLAMGMTRRFKSYVNLATTEPKVRKLLSEFEMATFRDFIEHECKEPPNALTNRHQLLMAKSPESSKA
jgi:hypothetical protein